MGSAPPVSIYFIIMLNAPSEHPCPALIMGQVASILKRTPTWVSNPPPPPL